MASVPKELAGAHAARHLHRMGRRTAPLAVKIATIVVFVAVAATYGLNAYKPANPQWPLLIFVSLGIGVFLACIVFFIGNVITHPITKEVARAAVDRRSVGVEG